MKMCKEKAKFAMIYFVIVPCLAKFELVKFVVVIAHPILVVLVASDVRYALHAPRAR